MKEIHARIGFLIDVGLDYLTLSRATANACPAVRRSVSVWLHRSAPDLVGVAYILDEPSIGLHQRDNDKLLATLLSPARFGQHCDRGRA